MRLENWNPNQFDESFENVTMDRLIEAGYIIKDATTRRLRGVIGSGKTTGINRPIYKTGKYAGKAWTARYFGDLLKSIRLVRDKTPSGKAFTKKRNVRIYAGTYNAYYARILEFNKPFMRPAFHESMSKVKEIIGAK